ncbi:hypothetical protein GC088_08790 [Arthrobacter sp. JZ12]|uniref:hypothetical protein n=1 Tax=Arthrobacter sp. JZ12 TaxID=2654190 RepID=UPI002B4A3386|nr:hypothetical protein [Arthrobacter sp. JZ12]WRH25148.1 hypothetical protein GC088_08790 [Arthrobacter sp. JZ12]
MNTRSCLLTVGASALLLTGSIIGAAPASAAPGSPECVAAETALKTELGVATVDINLANQVRTVIISFEAIIAQLDPLYAAFDLFLENEIAALNAAGEAASDAEIALEIAKTSLKATDLADPAYSDAETVVAEAEDAHKKAMDAYLAAQGVYDAAARLAPGYNEILALEAQADDTLASLDDTVVALGLTEGADPERLLTLADAAIAACSAAAVVAAPVATTPAPQQQQRGLNIQTAANDVDATAPANLGLLAGLAGLGAAAGATALVVRRRQAQ